MKIIAITQAEKQELVREMQDYIREMSEFDPTIEAVNGVYEYPYLDAYWSDDTRWPFWVVEQGERAGFALIRRTEEGPMEMAEFYVRPAHRRSGIGMSFARDLIARTSALEHLGVSGEQGRHRLLASGDRGSQIQRARIYQRPR